VVRVDEMRVPGRGPTCFRGGSCHLTADSLEELHRFAIRIGLQRTWFQNHPLLPHYDLTKSKRALAMKAGAIFVPTVDQIKTKRSGG